MAILIPLIWQLVALDWLPPSTFVLCAHPYLVLKWQLWHITHFSIFKYDYHGNYFCSNFHTLHALSCRVKKTTTRVTKQNRRDPLERIHAKLSKSGNSDDHEAPVKKTAATLSTVPISSVASGRPSPPGADV